MKHDWIGRRTSERTEFIAGFGGASIVRRQDGRLEICGGTEEEQAQAREWARRFLDRTLAPSASTRKLPQV